jgi:hypothetical protein
MARALQTYGPQDWSHWDFRAELSSPQLQLRHLHLTWTGGALRLATVPEALHRIDGENNSGSNEENEDNSNGGHAGG